MKKIALAGAVAVLTATPAYATGEKVTVRVEGATQTLLDDTVVTLDGVATPAPGNCAGNTAAAALEKATNGNWDRMAFTQTILGELHKFDNSDYWGEWVSEKYGSGICNDVVHDGDRVVLLVDVSDPVTYASTVFPMTATAPVIASPGTPFNVNVTIYKPDNGAPGTGIASPAEGASIVAGGQTFTAGSDGKVAVTLGDRGEQTIKATLGGSRTPKIKVCVTDGADGFCGTVKPGQTTSTTTAPAATTSALPPVSASRITAVKEQQKFKRSKAPRSLGGVVTVGAQGLKDVSIRLTRTNGARCEGYDGKREKFVKLKEYCSKHGTFFTVGSQADWTYLLPAKLSKGRYVLDVRATDNQGGTDAPLQRGRNRIVFFVS